MQLAHSITIIPLGGALKVKCRVWDGRWKGRCGDGWRHAQGTDDFQGRGTSHVVYLEAVIVAALIVPAGGLA